MDGPERQSLWVWKSGTERSKLEQKVKGPCYPISKEDEMLNVWNQNVSWLDLNWKLVEIPNKKGKGEASSSLDEKRELPETGEGTAPKKTKFEPPEKEHDSVLGVLVEHTSLLVYHTRMLEEVVAAIQNGKAIKGENGNGKDKCKGKAEWSWCSWEKDEFDK